MNIIVKKSFSRDIDKIRSKDLRLALDTKILQIERAKDLSRITGIKQLRGYKTHYRIIVKTEKFSYRIGVVVRNETIWLVRFLSRKTVYRLFP
ncbi:MAG: hypothetical protein LBE82_13450 [Chitinophagaceae bacterium]|jgi:mRNA interferase RelE/StbE|nr:hypothetical protein [Chitinophagaceae bacterium]